MGRIKITPQEPLKRVNELKIDKTGYVTQDSLLLTEQADLYLNLLSNPKEKYSESYSVKVTKINNKKDGYEISSNYLEHLKIEYIEEDSPDFLISKHPSYKGKYFFQKIYNMKNHIETNKIFEKILDNKLNIETNYRNLYLNSMAHFYNDRKKISNKLKKDLV